MLGCILKRQYDVPFSNGERASVVLKNHTIYEHKTLQINYTSYDMRRAQDSLNRLTNPNVMVLSSAGEEHPYWYAQIIGIYHAIVNHPSLLEPILMNFLWVRWYGMEPSPSYRFGWKAWWLSRLGFVEDTDDFDTSPAFGFIDTSNIIRAIHLIPAFHHGFTDDLLGPSTIACPLDEGDVDWNFFYVMMFILGLVF